MAKEKSVPGFYDFSCAGYKDEKTVVDFTVGLYYLKGGGCDCEFALELERLQADRFGWKIRMWDDSWQFLPRFKKLLDNLSIASRKLEKRANPYREYRHLTREQIEAILTKSGFKKLERSA